MKLTTASFLTALAHEAATELVTVGATFLGGGGKPLENLPVRLVVGSLAE